MKKQRFNTKLSLEKLKITRLTNPGKIRGGGFTTGDSQTDEDDFPETDSLETIWETKED